MATSIATERKRIERQIERLQRQQAALMKKERAPIIKQIVGEMRELNISPEDIADAFGQRPGAGRSQHTSPAKSAAKSKAGKLVPPKYKNPQTGETWTGRGRTPRWLSELEADGASRDDFLIEQEGKDAANKASSSPAQEEQEDRAEAGAQTQP